MFAVAFVLLFAAMALWSVATPLYAAPDEPVQVIKAAAVVRGELSGSSVGAIQPAYGLVNVPAFYADSRNLPVCFHRRSFVPASCEPAAPVSSASTPVWIYNAHYPPLYYSIVGLPSLLGTGSWALYLMRLTSALLSALLLASAFTAALAWSRSRVVLVGVLVATTPMVLFLGGVVNPSGLEVSAAISTWTCGSVLVIEHLDDPPPGLVGLLGLSACVFELTRGISPFWLACSALVLVGLAGGRGLVRLLHNRSVLVALGAVLAFGGVALGWTFSEHALDVISVTPLGRAPEATILETSFAHNDYYLPGMIGVFGWFDTYAPTFTYVVWYGLVGVVGVVAAVVGRLRQAVVLGLLVVGIVVIPVAISSSQVHRYGYTWSGRDTLPLAVGLPIVAGALLAKSALSEHRARLAGIVGLLVVLAQFAAFFEALRRYSVGTRGSDFGFLVHPAWRPPLGFGPVLGGEAAVLVALVALVTRLVRSGLPDRLVAPDVALGPPSGRVAESPRRSEPPG